MSGSWDENKRLALHRDGFECNRCSAAGSRLHVHHIEYRSEGGSDDLDNLETLCPDCHADEHDAEACDICGGLVYDSEGATLTDEGGGAWMDLCDECEKYIKKTGTGGQRCAICARIKSENSKADGITFFSDYEEGGSVPPCYPVCDECRRNLIFKPRGQRERYLDDQLPDSHVNVRHWEADGDE